jgi:hypothetical protein
MILAQPAERPLPASNEALIRAALAAVHALGFLISILTYLTDSRLSIHTYQLFGAIQAATLYYQFRSRNYVVCVLGFCLTSMLIIATAVESAPALRFDMWFDEKVYRPEVIRRAYDVLLGTACMFHLATMLLAPRAVWHWGPPDRLEKATAGQAIWPLVFISCFLYTLTSTGRPVTEATYATIEQASGAGPLAEVGGGLQLLATYFLCFVVVASVREAGYMSRKHLALLAFVSACVFYFRILRGSRGDSVVLLATMMVIFIQHSQRSEWLKIAILSVATGLAVIVLQAWSMVRLYAAYAGLTGSLVPAIVGQLDLLTSGTFHVFDVTLLPATYWHLLHVIDLYDVDGIRLNGMTFFNLIPQAIPSFIAEGFGVERPVNVAWILAEYRAHGGGMYVIAEGYWNLGFWGAHTVAGLMAGVALFFEKWARRQRPLVATAYFGFLGMSMFGVFYSLQAFVRAFEVAIVLGLGLAAVMKYMDHRVARRSGTIEFEKREGERVTV